MTHGRTASCADVNSVCVDVRVRAYPGRLAVPDALGTGRGAGQTRCGARGGDRIDARSSDRRGGLQLLSPHAAERPRASSLVPGYRANHVGAAPGMADGQGASSCP